MPRVTGVRPDKSEDDPVPKISVNENGDIYIDLWVSYQ